MAPGPLFASPPETDQVTAAAPPPVSVAPNCSTDVPCAPVALQPVQLVSMEPVPGESVKLPFEGSAVTGPPPQPAATSKAGATRIAAIRNGNLLRKGERTREFPGFEWGNEPSVASCANCRNVSVAFLGAVIDSCGFDA